MDTDSTPAEPVAETAAHTSEKHFEELKHEIRLATRSSRSVTNTQDSIDHLAEHARADLGAG